MHKVLLIGHLGGDPVSRYMPDGTATVSVSLATREVWKGKDGQKKDHTEWHRLQFFGRRAEIAQQYLHKGSKIFIEGRIRRREWEKDGIKQHMSEIQVDEMEMLDGKPPDGYAAGSNAPPRAAAAANPARQERYESGFDDDIPF